jgi:ribosomal protein S18 acetylase RimI-like enzyme
MVEIVRARKEHLGHVERLWQEFIRAHRDAEPLWNPDQASAADFKKELGQQIDSVDTLVLVAVEQGLVIGFAIAKIENQPPLFKLEKWGTITDLGVAKEFRRRGAGKMLVAEMMNWFKENGIRLVQIYAITNNDLAMAFWPNQGFDAFSQRMYKLL